MKVLVVEDTKSMQVIISFLLKKKGYEVITANDGLEGLNKYKELKPDLVILDIMMPKMNGLECLKALKEFDTDVKVLMCSAIMESDKLDIAMNLGAIDYIMKPFSDEYLTEKLKDIEKLFI